MKHSSRWRNKMVSDEGGQDVVEYALVITLVAFSVIVSLKGFSTAVNWLANIGASLMSIF